MKKLSIILLSLCFFCKSKPTGSETSLLNAKEFQEKLASTPGAVLLDVRTFPEVKEESIKGEINFDFKSEGFKMLVQGLDKTKPYFVYCAGGVRSAKAADVMSDMGFMKIYTLNGGLKAWKEAGLPTRKSK